MLLSALFALGGIFLLVLATSSAADTGNGIRDPASRPPARGKEGALRSSTVVRHARAEAPPPIAATTRRESAEARGVILRTSLGDVRIHFTPELAGTSSIHYITQVVEAASAKRDGGSSAAKNADDPRMTEGVACQKCKFYRAEKQLLLQGIVSETSAAPRTQVALGPCPVEDYVPKSKCPAHDPHCGCHGPVMTKGMVGWAGGGAGPDFFINTFAKPVDWWENQHTVWGEVRDATSLAVVESVYELPAHMQGMRMLDRPIQFSLELF